MTRDPKSATVSRNLGRAPEVVSSDLVFALPEERSSVCYDVLFNVSGLLWSSNSHVDSDKYRKAVCDFVEHMGARGRSVTLLAHVVNGKPSDNDTAAIRELIEKYSLSNDYVLPSSLNEARQVIAGANLVVGARMHACLNALSLGVPSIPWAYSRKFEPLLGELGWKHLVDLNMSADPALATAAIIDEIREDELKRQAIDVSEAGRRALALTADGIRKIRA